MVSVGTKPPLVHIVEALYREYCFLATKSLSGLFLLATKACQVTTVTLILLYTTNLLHEAWGLHVPRTNLSTLLHIKLGGRRLAGEPPKLKGAGIPRYKLE